MTSSHVATVTGKQEKERAIALYTKIIHCDKYININLV